MGDSCRTPAQPDCAVDPSSPLLAIPPADFSSNPCFEISVDGQLEITVDTITLRIYDLSITGRFYENGAGFNNGVFDGTVDPAPLADLLGVNPCSLISGICDPQGRIYLRVEELTAHRIEGAAFGSQP